MYRPPSFPFEDVQYSESTAGTSRGVLISVMNVAIRPGQKQKIFIHEFDNQYELAQGFIYKHKLDQKILPILQKEIEANKMVYKDSNKPEQLYPSSYKKHEDLFPPKYSDKQEYIFRKNSQYPPGIYTSREHNQIENDNSNQIQNEIEIKSSKMSRTRSTTDITNRLYNENIMKTKYLLEVEQKALQKLQKLKAEGGSYKPEINVISNALASQRRKNNNIEDHLVELGNQATQRKERAASLKMKKQVEECSFRPSLNKMSNKLTTARRQPTFSRALMRNTDHSYDNLFKPATNKISQEIMQNKPSTFLSRQRQFQQTKQARINRMYKQKRAQQTIDPKTGAHYFKPTSSTYKPKIWNENQLQIGEYLYQKGRTKQPVVLTEKKVKINKYSEELVKNLQAKRIVWLFGELDSDQDGLICSQFINIQTIPDDILQIIMPILFEMEEFHFKLNIQEFRIALEHLHKSLTTTQKSILYDYNKGKGKV